VRRGTLRADGTVEVSPPGSHLLRDYARATVLVHVPIGVSPCRRAPRWRSGESMSDLTHLRADGSAHMVDVTDKVRHGVKRARRPCS
jgi:hypothetical protein